MKKNVKYIKIVILFFTLVIVNLYYPNISKAGYNTYKSFNNAPRMKIITNSSKYDDVTIRFTDYNGITEENIKFYLMDSKDGKQEIKSNKFIISHTTEKSEDGKKDVIHNYVISKKYLNKQTKRFYVEVTDNSGMVFKSTFRIVSKNKKYYAVDYAPRIINWSVSGNNVTLDARDLGGSRYVKIYDLNDSSKLKITENDLEKGNAEVKFDISEFTPINGRYGLKIVAADNGKNAQKATRTVRFNLKENPNPVEPEKPTEEDPNAELSIELDRNVLMLDMDYYNYAYLEAKVTPPNAKVTWESKNTDVVTVSKKGKVKAVSKLRPGKVGTDKTTIKVTAEYGGKIKTATCSVRIFTHITKPTSSSQKGIVRGSRFGNYVMLYKKQFASKEELEAYINNAAKIVETTTDYSRHPEAKARSLPYYSGTVSRYAPGWGVMPKFDRIGGSREKLSIRKTYKKKNNQFDINNKFVLKSTINQWIYCFEKDSSGVWHLKLSGQSTFGAAGITVVKSKFCGYIYTRENIFTSNYRTSSLTPGTHLFMVATNKGNSYGAWYHIGATPGYPDSGGCFRLGSPNGALYKWVDKAGPLTCEIFY